MRRLRFIPEGGALVEVTCRTLHSRFLLRATPLINDVVVGVLGRAQRMYPIRVCSYAFASNHFHLILEIGKLVGWREKIWARRYQAMVISSEEAAQVERLKYVLAHGVKEGLVEKVTQWPGVHCAQALLTGESVQGYWIDETQAYAARRRGEDFDRMRFATLEALTLSPLPCWKHLPEEKQRQLVAALIAEIEAEAEIRRQRTGSQVLGVSAVRGQHPFDRPRKSKKSPAPLFHAASQVVRRELYEAYRWFVGVFRDASEKLRAGDRTAKFPVGSFPPALPFVAG